MNSSVASIIASFENNEQISKIQHKLQATKEKIINTKVGGGEEVSLKRFKKIFSKIR